MADLNFRNWLQQMNTLGHEIVIHGFFHERARQAKETARQKIVTRFYTADEGEFFDLDYPSALQLIRDAQRDFEANGFRPRGFIAPAWLISAEAERAAIDAGMIYTTTLRSIRDFVAREEYFSQSLVYSVRSGWRRDASLAWNRWLFLRLTTTPLLRFGIHPPDIAHTAVWRQIGRMVDQALRDRQAMTYLGWLQAKSGISNQQSAIG